MACLWTCTVSMIFIIGMIYFYARTYNNPIVKEYQKILSTPLRERYNKIVQERMMISVRGYVLGLILAVLIIWYNTTIKHMKMGNISLVCTVVATAFLTNYFYYMISPKSDWMLNHIDNQQLVKAWLAMYKEMQYSYHMGLVLGIVAVGIFAFAFRG